jgi:membrane fusion protein (multidrug efflux system)
MLPEPTSMIQESMIFHPPRSRRFCLRIGYGLAGAVVTLARARAAMPPPEMPVTRIKPATFRTAIELSGQIAAVRGATLAASRAGMAVAVNFHSGETVQKGAVLVRLDDSVERAQLALDQAKLDEARRTLARDERLRAIAGVAIAQLETAEAVMAEAQAQITLDRAHADKLKIAAPFSGQLGIRLVSPGDYLQIGAKLTTITQTAPLRVFFAVPETELDGLKPGNSFTISVPESGQTVSGSHRGTIIALSPRISTKTHARMVEGRIGNTSGQLLPGMYGTVALATGAPVAAFSVPAAALNYGPIGSYLYAVAKAGNNATVHAVYVDVLSSVGKTTLVRGKGLRGNEAIIAFGGFKLHDGQTIKPASG